MRFSRISRDVCPGKPLSTLNNTPRFPMSRNGTGNSRCNKVSFLNYQLAYPTGMEYRP